MSTGWKFVKSMGIVVLCLGSLSFASETTKPKKVKKPVQLAPLPSGPTGPVPQVPLDSMKPVAPQVSYQNGQLTIIAPNSTLGDILRAVRKQTGAEIEIPEATDRVVTRLGPGPAREVIAELLNGSRFNYVLLGSPEDAGQLTRVVLVAKAGPDTPKTGAQPGQPQAAAQPANGGDQTADAAPDAPDADTAEENAADDTSTAPEQQQEAEQPADQPGVKTPQQMLQEMQQRQLMLQQQIQQQGVQPGQPMPPGPGVTTPQQRQQDQ